MVNNICMCLEVFAIRCRYVLRHVRRIRQVEVIISIRYPTTMTIGVWSDQAGVARKVRQPSGVRSHALCCGLLGLLSVLPHEIPAQTAASFSEVGHFYMQSFAPESYGGQQQNWALAQDERGILYVANGNGVLAYDGVSWSLTPISNLSIALSLAVDSGGRVFVGAVAELGYLAPDQEGQTRYVSLVEHIPEEDRDFTDVWNTYALRDGVYFLSGERLFRWRDGRMEVWRPESGFHVGLAVHETFYVTDRKTGVLYVMEGDKLRPAPGGSLFAGQQIYALVPHGGNAFGPGPPHPASTTGRSLGKRGHSAAPSRGSRNSSPPPPKVTRLMVCSRIDS